jgi:pilus assembly protein Flp/PilA
MFTLGMRFQLIRDAIRNQLAKLADDDRGVTMLEYTILIGIITVAVILSVIFAGSWVASQWGTLTSALGA